MYSIIERHLSGKRKPDALSGNSVYLAEPAAKILFQAGTLHKAYDDIGSGAAGGRLLTVHRQPGVPPPGFILPPCRFKFIASLPQRLNPLISASVMKGDRSGPAWYEAVRFAFTPFYSAHVRLSTLAPDEKKPAEQAFVRRLKRHGALNAAGITTHHQCRADSPPQLQAHRAGRQV
jgi:hypothetical protein